MIIQNRQYLSLEQMQERLVQNPKSQNQRKNESAIASFQDILQAKQDYQNQSLQSEQTSVSLKFSKHASNRLANRNITLSEGQMERLELGAVKASEKGIKESLVLVDSLAFIVNVPNKTVVTAMDQTQADENIYTNIDGAVIM